MNQTRARWRVLAALLGIAALLFSACADAPVDDEPDEPVDEVVEQDFVEVLEPGEQPSLNYNCFLSLLENVGPAATPGQVGDAEVSNECDSLVTEQRMEVCIEVTPANELDLLDPPAESASFDTLGCETLVGTTLTLSNLTVAGRDGNHWYRHAANTEADATNDTGGTTTTVFPTFKNGWANIACFAEIPGTCQAGAYVPPPPPPPCPGEVNDEGVCVIICEGVITADGLCECNGAPSADGSCEPPLCDPEASMIDPECEPCVPQSSFDGPICDDINLDPCGIDAPAPDGECQVIT